MVPVLTLIGGAMTELKELNVFDKILEPVFPLIKEAQDKIPGDSNDYKLSLLPFTVNLLFAIICRIETIGKLVTEIKSSPVAEALELVKASKSMYSEAFRRYDSSIWRNIFYQLLKTLNFSHIPEINQLGRILLVDGSLFPAIASMQWAHYKKTANAIKLQLAFELNRMIPVEFLCTNGNFSEKKFLTQILKKGITYVCDRGYISFPMFKKICMESAYFIIRGKSNLQYAIESQLDVVVPDKFLKFFSDISDAKIVFNNDKNEMIYRIINFTALSESYCLITNRFDLTTYQVIMLYAYRWQVELCFRFLKRTLKGIHLFTQNKNGIQIQFYLYMIGYLILLSFKQESIEVSDVYYGTTIGKAESNEEPEEESTDKNHHSSQRLYVQGLVSLLGSKLKKYWKISIHWLIVLKNKLLEKFDPKIAQTLSSYN
jgi:hypothetical protein